MQIEPEQLTKQNSLRFIFPKEKRLHEEIEFRKPTPYPIDSITTISHPPIPLPNEGVYRTIIEVLTTAVKEYITQNPSITADEGIVYILQSFHEHFHDNNNIHISSAIKKQLNAQSIKSIKRQASISTNNMKL